jgi:superfamily II RNA helicase
VKKTIHLYKSFRQGNYKKNKKQVQIDVETFVKSFRPDIMEVVYAWAKGSKFYEIMEITQVF